MGSRRDRLHTRGLRGAVYTAPMPRPTALPTAAQRRIACLVSLLVVGAALWLAPGTSHAQWKWKD